MLLQLYSLERLEKQWSAHMKVHATMRMSYWDLILWSMTSYSEVWPKPIIAMSYWRLYLSYNSYSVKLNRITYYVISMKQTWHTCHISNWRIYQLFLAVFWSETILRCQCLDVWSMTVKLILEMSYWRFYLECYNYICSLYVFSMMWTFICSMSHAEEYISCDI